MKRILILILSIGLLLSLAACGDDGKAGGKEKGKDEVKIIRAGTGANSEHSSYKGLEKFKEIFEEKTDGAFEVEIYHSGQIGDDTTMTEGLQLGTQEIAVPSVDNITPLAPEFSVLGFPFLFPSKAVAYDVLDGEVGQGLFEKLTDKNLVGLAYWENGFRNTTNDKGPIESMADLKGLKLRTMQSKLHIEVFSKLGANPTPMSFSELYTGLQQGTVDGQENPYPLIYQQKFHEVQKYMTNTQHVYSPYIFLVGKGFYDDLSEEQQEILKEASIEAGKYQREINEEQEIESLEGLIDEGVVFTELSDEARQEMIETVQPVIDKYTEEIGTDLVNDVYEAVKNSDK